MHQPSPPSPSHPTNPRFKDGPFNIKPYLHKSHLHERLILAYIGIMKLVKKNYFRKFVEELDFVQLSILAKHMRVWILHDDGLNDDPRYYYYFLHFEITKV